MRHSRGRPKSYINSFLDRRSCFFINSLNYPKQQPPNNHFSNFQTFSNFNQQTNMSDSGRKDWSTKAKEEMTPDSTKSTQDKVKETVTDTGDRISRGVQPDDQKSTGQQAFDKTQRSHDNHQGGATETIGQKVKNAVGLGDN
ncbi:heat shock 9/12 family protein [Aspergillus undulatus]|uniref:heat shock 9/12 family protein n=1 Tax=Aspergillus undulatus TaxID=1810928 RepID=UPI003CCDB443